MILNDVNIKEYGDGLIRPFDEGNLQPASYDLTLGDSFIRDGAEFTSNSGVYLDPGDFLLGSTSEWLNIPSNICARVEGKSSLGRCGLMVHCTAGFIDPGFRGNVTLELFNAGSSTIFLHVGACISQVCFMRLTGPACNVYGDSGLGSHYQGQEGVTGSVVDYDEDEDIYLVLE